MRSSSRTGRWISSAAAGTVLVLASTYGAAPSGATAPQAASERAPATWRSSWATAQHTTGAELDNQTVRTIVHLSQGGPRLRISLANQATSAPITVDRVTVARREGASGVNADSVRVVQFDGRRAVTIKPGQRVTSDPVRLRTQAQDDLFVDTYVAGTAIPSAHGAAFDTSYLTPDGSGDHTGQSSGDAFTETTTSYLLLSAVDVAAADVVGTIVVVGGSVVDGLGSRSTGTLGQGPGAPPNSRWSDVLARRLLENREPDQQVSVANAGIGGNTASPECASDDGKSRNVTQRYTRDVLSRSGLTHVFVYAGTNDVAFGCTAGQIIDAFKGLARRAHERGVDIIFATVTPRAKYTAGQNEIRLKVNRWLLKNGTCSGHCEGVADFDTAIAAPDDPNRIDPAYDSGDGIHPNAEGYAKMASTVPLRLFR